MAPVPATLQIDFTSNYPLGSHRVCYRIAGSGSPYTCTTVTCTPFVPPAPPVGCQALIAITVDNESCDPVTYEGYVQATCEELSSTAGREPFTITFTPVPTCTPVRLQCNNVGILSITITDGGTGYDPLSLPTVTAVGGGGTSTLTAVVSGGGVLTGITVVSSSGYSSLPSISIDPSPAPGGVQATAVAVMAPCPGFVAGTNCDGSSKGSIGEQEIGADFNICYTGGLSGGGTPVFPTEYTATNATTECCYDCRIYTITPVDPSTAVTYSDCTNNGNTTTVNVLSGAPPTIICATEGSVTAYPSSGVTIVMGASC